jgi:hypothetical protein
MRMIGLAIFSTMLAFSHSAGIAQTRPIGTVKIAVTDIVQNKDEVMVSLDVSNRSSKSFDRVEAACAIFNSAGMMIGAKRPILLHDLQANSTAHDGTIVTVLKSQVGNKAICRLNDLRIVD